MGLKLEYWIIHLESFNWLSHRVLSAIYTVLYEYGRHMRDFLGHVFCFSCWIRDDYS